MSSEADALLTKWNDGCGLLTGYDAERAVLQQSIDAAIREAVKAEREACELIVMRRRDNFPGGNPAWHATDAIAKDIRAHNPQQETHDE